MKRVFAVGWPVLVIALVITWALLIASAVSPTYASWSSDTYDSSVLRLVECGGDMKVAAWNVDQLIRHLDLSPADYDHGLALGIARLCQLRSGLANPSWSWIIGEIQPALDYERKLGR